MDGGSGRHGRLPAGDAERHEAPAPAKNEELKKQNDYILFDKYRNLINELNSKLKDIKLKISTHGNDEYIYGKEAINHFLNEKYVPNNMNQYNLFIKENKKKVTSDGRLFGDI